jgi:septum formation protein
MNQKVILASGSPRRKELLERAGVEFQILVPDVDETPIKKETPQKMVARLSLLKAETVSRMQGEPGPVLILAADTTVVSATGKNLGKPETLAEAHAMIKALQGKRHSVFTAYSLLQFTNGKVKKKVTRTVRTDVYIKKLNAQEIEAYVARGESMDKAGAYGAQGFGQILIEKISGSYTNVVGLPIAQVVDDLKKLGWK